MIKRLSMLLLLPAVIGNAQVTNLPAEVDFVKVEPADLQDLRDQNFEKVVDRINSKNQEVQGAPGFLKEQIRRSIHFAFEARLADRNSGVEEFAKWLSASSEEEIAAFKGRVSDQELSDSYLVLAKLNALVLRDPESARRLYLEGLKPWIEGINETRTSLELGSQLASLEGEPRAALLHYIRLLRAEEYEAQRQEGFALIRARIAETENQEK